MKDSEGFGLAPSSPIRVRSDGNGGVILEVRADLEGEPVEQRPAAYRFAPRGDQIDVLPEPPDPFDRGVALDLYAELVRKARGLSERLQRTDSATRARASIDWLLDALGSFDSLRPGNLLSRVRAIEADRIAFDTPDARMELFADAFAMMDDVLQTARDLMAMFPIIRRIDAEQVALNLGRNSKAIPVIEAQTAKITEAAKASGGATDAALAALTQNDAAIASATDQVVRTSLIADKLLVFRNLTAAVTGTKAWEELRGLGAESWVELRAGLPIGVKTLAIAAPLVWFAVHMAGPTGALAALVPSFKAIGTLYKQVIGNRLRTGPKQVIGINRLRTGPKSSKTQTKPAVSNEPTISAKKLEEVINHIFANSDVNGATVIAKKSRGKWSLLVQYGSRNLTASQVDMITKVCNSVIRGYNTDNKAPIVIRYSSGVRMI